MNYYITHVSNDPSAPHINDIIGSPIQDNMACTIVIKSKLNPRLVLINHNVLREALLNNPEETERLLGIIVKDATVPDEPAVKEKPKTKKIKLGTTSEIKSWD